MLSPLVSERIVPPTNLFYCDCRADCVDSFTLPARTVELLMNDKTLILLIGNHRSEKTTGEVVDRGKGWKVCRVK